ncbi:DUF3164 family protein [Glaciecola sp. 1036]|uniref:DUF3164 family protein n=1 Tax=Alteromonadaceae TaxID=72275 RepID=UPI003D085643
MLDTKKLVERVHELSDTKALDGFMLDEVGNQIRVSNIKEYDLIRDKLVKEMARDAAVLADEMQAAKERFSAKFEQHIERMENIYKVKVGGRKGNVSLSSFDRKLKIERTKQDRMTTNEHMVVAVQLVDQCLAGWAKGSNRNLQAFVRKYFRTDAKGNFNIADLQRVRRLELETPDPLWEKAMEALDNAIEHDTTVTYFRAFVRDESGKYLNIPLDFAKV